ncbi:MAG: DUF3482 domain-containing protein [Rubrivivax sp.]|nr:DUF3482 domain-containing protein [Rubrivivax sp.]
MTAVTLSLVSHTNAGKTTLARTLLGRDIGEVRDAPHVTELPEAHLLLETPSGHRLLLWDTPGFGDSVRLARRMRSSGNPLGWLLSQLWDRWRDPAFWMSQQALRHVRDDSDLLLYLVNATEPDAGYLQSEMQLLAWTGKPVLVLLNQLGAPREAAVEAAEVEQWRERLAAWPQVRGVLSLDAFARCWVQEGELLGAVEQAFAGDAGRSAAMAELRAAWTARREAQFAEAVRELAASLARVATLRVALDEPAGLAAKLREWGTRLVQSHPGDPVVAAEQRLADALADEVRASTRRLLELHGLEQGGGSRGASSGDEAVTHILERVARQVEPHHRVPEGRAAVLGGAITGALAGLKADLATGGLTLGGGLIAGGILGALGAAGLARGINVVRGTGRSWVAWSAAAMPPLAEAALLRYLAVAHFGRGRGAWAESEAPAHWPAALQQALAPCAESFDRVWKSRVERLPEGGEAAEAERLAAALAPLVEAVLRDVLARLHPAAFEPAPDRGTGSRRDQGFVPASAAAAASDNPGA